MCNASKSARSPTGPLARPPAPQNRHHAGACHALRYLEAPCAQPPGNEGGGARLLEADFRVAMDIVADRDEFRIEGPDRVDKLVHLTRSPG